MTRPKDKGTAWETAIVNYLTECGVPFVERRTLSGPQDKGDIAGIPGVVIEAKDEKRHDLSGWLAEAIKERDNAGAEIGVVWAKKRGKTSPGAAYVIMDGVTLMNLLMAGGYIPRPILDTLTEEGDPSPEK